MKGMKDMKGVKHSFLRNVLSLAALSLGVALPLHARQAPVAVDAAVNAKIRDEGLNRSQVLSMFSTLVDDIGPRLAGSPEYKRAAEWARGALEKAGATNARLESWEFGRAFAAHRGQDCGSGRRDGVATKGRRGAAGAAGDQLHRDRSRPADVRRS